MCYVSLNLLNFDPVLVLWVSGILPIFVSILLMHFVTSLMKNIIAISVLIRLSANVYNLFMSCFLVKYRERHMILYSCSSNIVLASIMCL